MKAYSIDLRQKVVEAVSNQEDSQREIAKRFKVSLSFVQRLLKRYRETGNIEPASGGRGFEAQLTKYESLVEELVRENNDATLAELKENIYQRTKVIVSCSSLCRFLQKRKWTRKKNALCHSSPK
ncbi:helix-turn-helix domain-containing protein [Coleofasciculus sp. G2-EDA-02]|uniref:helix-turn-helix domain-containing protein n=1 Tax=Coleofasciculus sp. G2-EDA-02 TaxID=3069529 RepID=UPI0032F41CB6